MSVTPAFRCVLRLSRWRQSLLPLSRGEGEGGELGSVRLGSAAVCSLTWRLWVYLLCHFSVSWSYFEGLATVTTFTQALTQPSLRTQGDSSALEIC